MLKSRLSCSAVSALILVVSSSAMGQETLMDAGQIDPATVQKFFKKPGYSPYAGRNYPAQVFWGDEHVHTGWSVDAGMSGATLTPEDAVRFARGEEVLSSTGQPAKLGRPLDWIAVTDHSDGMGVISEIKAGNPELMADPVQKRWHDMMLAGPEQAAAATMELINAQANKQLPASIMDPKFAKSVWLKNSAIME
ncbi:hypothetical protein SM11_pC0238 (plasmid) [Sinorhizobium meliloti SM11]|uniref:DUF3604 domain-containing protein n=2 Tax=Rhizobium meliloti TaxID=382 RepID=F7XBT9_SINMM|nr:hypothetical protein SM11_pC0238 [Sinorhizobium meliloti SM11]